MSQPTVQPKPAMAPPGMTFDAAWDALAGVRPPRGEVPAHVAEKRALKEAEKAAERAEKGKPPKADEEAAREAKRLQKMRRSRMGGI